MKVHVSASALKILYASSIPPLMLLIAGVGGSGYGLIFTLLILAGGFCVGSVMRQPSNRWTAGIVYVVALWALLYALV